MVFVNVARDPDVLRFPQDEGGIALACRNAFGPATEVEASELMLSGRFNTTYRLRIKDRGLAILRLAPMPGSSLFRHECRLLQRESAIQPLLSDLGPLFPKTLFSDFSCRHLPRPYVVQTCLEGRLWEEAAPELTAVEQDSLWAQFGGLVRRIHSLVGAGYGFPPPCSSWQRYGDWFISQVEDLVLDLAEHRIVVPGLDNFRRLVTMNRSLFDAAGSPRLVHGDLWLRNVLVVHAGGGWRISGILDAERAFWGEPGAEWIFSFLDIPASFWSAYGVSYREEALDASALVRRRAYQARGALQLILEGNRFGFDARFARDHFSHSVTELEATTMALASRGLAKAA